MASVPLPAPQFGVDLLPPRAAIETAIETMVAVLNILDGDPDIELNGDELDEINAEDAFMSHSSTDLGAGCPIADPDLAVDDHGCDPRDEDGV